MYYLAAILAYIDWIVSGGFIPAYLGIGVLGTTTKIASKNIENYKKYMGKMLKSYDNDNGGGGGGGGGRGEGGVGGGGGSSYEKWGSKWSSLVEFSVSKRSSQIKRWSLPRVENTRTDLEYTRTDLEYTRTDLEYTRTDLEYTRTDPNMVLPPPPPAPRI